MKETVSHPNIPQWNQPLLGCEPVRFGFDPFIIGFIADDNLDVSDAIEAVTEMMEAIHSRKTDFMDVWLSWRYKSSVSTETDTQWKQVEKTIHKVCPVSIVMAAKKDDMFLILQPWNWIEPYGFSLCWEQNRMCVKSLCRAADLCFWLSWYSNLFGIEPNLFCSFINSKKSIWKRFWCCDATSLLSFQLMASMENIEQSVFINDEVELGDDLESNQSLLESLEARSDLTRALQTEIEAAVKVRGRYFIWLFLYDVKILSLGFSW